MVQRQPQAVSAIFALIIALGCCGLYLLLARVLGGSQRPTSIGAGVALYVLFAFEFAPLLSAYYAQYRSQTARMAIQAGSALGTLISMSVLYGLWHFLGNFVPLRLALTAFAALLLFRVAALAIRRLNPYEPPLNLMWKILTPVNRFFAPVLTRIIPDPPASIPNGLTPQQLTLRLLVLPLITMHEYTGFLTLNVYLDVFGFGLGVIIANVLFNVGLQFYADRFLRLLRNSTFIIFSATIFLLLIVLGLYQMYLILTL
jgi:hypothetical protein